MASDESALDIEARKTQLRKVFSKGDVKSSKRGIFMPSAIVIEVLMKLAELDHDKRSSDSIKSSNANIILSILAQQAVLKPNAILSSQTKATLAGIISDDIEAFLDKTKTELQDAKILDNQGRMTIYAREVISDCVRVDTTDAGFQVTVSFDDYISKLKGMAVEEDFDVGVLLLGAPKLG